MEETANTPETSRGLAAIVRTSLTGRRPLHRILALCICTTILVVWNTNAFGLRVYRGQMLPSFSSELACRSLPGANETVVALRTGSTELDDRFPVHLDTTLRCYPHYLLFSDFDEHYRDEHIIDALESVSPEIRTNNKDFELYRRLQSAGRANLSSSELSGSQDAFSRAGGKTENPGWKLDKWKFLPMVNRTMHEYPNMKWYVFIEADTYVLWSMLLQYMALFDHTLPHYRGSPAYIASDLFAHGGSGFFLSHAAMRKITDYYAAHKVEIEKFTDGHWAGDCVLGKYLKDAGVPMKSAWPHFQGDYPGLVPYAGADGRGVPSERITERCFPTISYHHMTPEMIAPLWHWEQQWIETHNRTDTLRHWDVFEQFVMPQIARGSRSDWDNFSDKEVKDIHDLDACQASCEAQPDCKQFSLVTETKVCKIRAAPRLGRKANGTQSGWLQDRVLTFEHTIPPCKGETWITN